jgi:integrase
VSGFRLRECVDLRWSGIDWGNLTISVIGKGDKADVQPFTPDIRDFLWELRGQHPEKVFTYVAAQTRPERRIIAGQRYPITYEGLSTAWRRAKLHAKFVDYRFHDNRAARRRFSDASSRALHRICEFKITPGPARQSAKRSLRTGLCTAQ